MQRKLIKQGGGGLTMYLPKKWIDTQGLKAGDEVEIIEENKVLTINSGKAKKRVRSTTITIEHSSFNTYRSLIGGHYRAGYDEIKVLYKDPKVITILQKAVDSLYGYEIFDIDEKSCMIRNMYEIEAIDVKTHIMRMIHIIKTMQKIIHADLKEETYHSKEELHQFRNNVLRQRDTIIRTIIQKRLLENKHFPYHTISHSLWNIARNYYLLYTQLKKKKCTKRNLQFFEMTNTFFKKMFNTLTKERKKIRYKDYEKIREEGFKLMQDRNEASIVVSFCINILMATQSADSSLLILNS